MPIGIANNNVIVEGWDELKKALDQLPKATARAVQQRVLMKRAAPIVAAMKAYAPVYHGSDKDIPIGYLRDSIRATTKRPRGYKTPSQREFAKTLAMTGSRSAAIAAAKEAGTAPVVVFLGPAGGPGRKHLNWWMEYGTKFAPPHPYMRPALDDYKNITLNGIGQDMWDEIKKSADRLAKKRAKSAAAGGPYMPKS